MCASVYTANTVSNMKSMYCGVWRRRGGTKIVYMYVTAAYLCVCDVGMTLLLFFSYYNLMSTKYVLPVWSSSSCSFYKLFYSTVFSLSLLFNTWCRFRRERNIIIILLSLHHSYLFPNSRNTIIIVCPICFFAIFIFLEERSHLVFRLLYNWKMMRWQMHIYVQGIPR